MKKWALKALSDSDFASDKKQREVYLDTLSTFVGSQLPGKAKG